MIRLRLNGRYYENFQSLNVSLKLNTVASTFNFVGLNEFFGVLKYEKARVYFDNDLIITGTILNPAYEFTKTPTLVAVNGYSLPGILEDCNYPTSLYPTEFNGLSLRQIAQKICNYFNITLKVFPNATNLANQIFEKVSISESESIKQFLTKLCNQRGLVLAHDNFGRLLIYRITNTVGSSLDLSGNDNITINYTPNAQGFHSDVTVLNQSNRRKRTTEQVNVRSPFVSGITRPIVRKLTDGENIRDTARKIICDEARNFKLKLTFPDMVNFRAGFYLTLEEPTILKSRTRFLAESVDFNVTKSSTTTIITAVLPCVYTGILPRSNPFK